jgi:DNA invertase Pin-like site-specific DNA recombinase
VSTDEQRLGVAAQREAIERWAAGAGVQVAAWHVDAGVSGATEACERPELGAALAALREHGAGVLVVAKRDRVARDVAIAATVERLAIAAGARVVAADGSGNGDGPADALMRTMVDAMAAYERALIRQRTAAALRVMAARGEHTGGEPPFGWRVGEDGVRLERDDDEQSTRARASELRASGLSLRAVAAALAAEGRLSRAGTPFAPLAVSRMIERAPAVDAAAE